MQLEVLYKQEQGLQSLLLSRVVLELQLVSMIRASALIDLLRQGNQEQASG